MTDKKRIKILKELSDLLDKNGIEINISEYICGGNCIAIYEVNEPYDIVIDFDCTMLDSKAINNYLESQEK